MMTNEIKIINGNLYVKTSQIYTMKELYEMGSSVDDEHISLSCFANETDEFHSRSISIYISKFFMENCTETILDIGNFHIEIKGNLVRIQHQYIIKNKKSFLKKGCVIKDSEIRDMFLGEDVGEKDIKVRIYLGITSEFFQEYYKGDNIKITLNKNKGANTNEK